MAAGIVLAGGASRRMGEPKATLDWHGTPLVAHVCAAVAAGVAGGPVIVVRAPGQPLPALPDGVLVVEDAVAGEGPLRGLLAGLDAAAATGERVAVAVPVDAPFLRPALLVALAAAVVGDGAAAPRTPDGRRHPLPCAFATARAAAVTAALQAGERSLRGMLAISGAVAVDVPAGEPSLTGMNDPAELAAARRAG